MVSHQLSISMSKLCIWVNYCSDNTCLNLSDFTCRLSANVLSKFHLLCDLASLKKQRLSSETFMWLLSLYLFMLILSFVCFLFCEHLGNSGTMLSVRCDFRHKLLGSVYYSCTVSFKYHIMPILYGYTMCASSI